MPPAAAPASGGEGESGGRPRKHVHCSGGSSPRSRRKAAAPQSQVPPGADMAGEGGRLQKWGRPVGPPGAWPLIRQACAEVFPPLRSSPRLAIRRSSQSLPLSCLPPFPVSFPLCPAYLLEYTPPFVSRPADVRTPRRRGETNAPLWRAQARSGAGAPAVFSSRSGSPRLLLPFVSSALRQPFPSSFHSRPRRSPAPNVEAGDGTLRRPFVLTPPQWPLPPGNARPNPDVPLKTNGSSRVQNPREIQSAPKPGEDSGNRSTEGRVPALNPNATKTRRRPGQ